MISYIRSMFSKEAVNENIRKVLFNIVTLGGTIGGAIALIISIFLKLAEVQIVAIALALGVLILGLYLANKKDMVNLAAFLIVAVITLILFPIMFYTDGGIYGGMGYWIALGIVFNFLLVEGWLFFIVLVLQLAMTLFCFVDSYIHPERIISLSSTGDVFVDTVQSLLVMSLVIGIIVRFQTKVYNDKLDELNRSEKKAMAAAEEALAAGRAKDVFLAQMSHEIRTPINAVLGMNEMILRESQEVETLDYASNIEHAGKTLLAVINAILDFSKIEDGKMEIIPVEYSTAVMISELVNSIQLRAQEKGLELIVKADETLPSVMMGDDLRLSQVILNLLTNALKYTEHGFVKLSIKKLKMNSSTVDFMVTVSDSGIGIRKEDMPRLFESFERLDETRNRHIEGTGLGISIVTRLLALMDSELNVDSTFGVGSEFSFVIRQGVVDAAPMGDYNKKAQEAARQRDVVDTISAPSARVLIVDDNDLNLKVAQNLLKLCGITPDTASSGAQAIELMKTHTYHIVFLDHMMPRMDGIETLAVLKEKKLIPVDTTMVALTANALAGAREYYMDAGFNDYLSKPIRIGDLMNTLDTWLPDEAYEASSADDSDKAMEFMPEAPEADTAAANAMKKLADAGIDTKSGLKYCAGDREFYFEILSDYASSRDRRLAELDEALQSQSWHDYEVLIHALKSASKTIGAMGLFETALALERAAAAEDEKYISENHEPAMQWFVRLADAISDLT